MNNPFDIIKAFYKKDYEKINDRDKSRNFFMINRTCAITYPLQANSFNNIKIPSDRVVDYWRIFITTKHRSLPGFIWTKTIKKEKVKEGNKYKEEVLDFIKERYQISNREINELIEFFPEKFKPFYKEIETLMS